MSSGNHTRRSWFSRDSLGYYCVAIVFLLIGIFIKRIPYVTLDGGLNIGDFATGLIAIIGLIGAWYFIPAVIEKAVQQRHSKDVILVDDIKEICEALRALISKYQKLYSDETVITEKIRGEILQNVRDITNMISELNSDMLDEHVELDFEAVVKNYYNEETYKILTEDLPVNNKIRSDHLLAASNSVTILHNRLRKYRFSTFK